MRCAKSQHEQRHTRQQEEEPEHRRGELDHGRETVFLYRPERDERQSNRGLNEKRDHGHVSLAVPLAHECQHRPVATERVVCAGADDHRGIDRCQSGNPDDRADQLSAYRPEGSLHDIGADGRALGHSREPEALEYGQYNEHIDDRDDEQREHQGSHDRARPALDLGRDVGRLVPAAVGEQHEDHRQAEHRGYSGGRRGRCRGLDRRSRDQPGDCHQQQATDLEERQQVLRACRFAQADDVDGGQHHDGQCRIDRG